MHIPGFSYHYIYYIAIKPKTHDNELSGLSRNFFYPSTVFTVEEIIDTSIDIYIRIYTGTCYHSIVITMGYLTEVIITIGSWPFFRAKSLNGQRFAV